MSDFTFVDGVWVAPVKDPSDVLDYTVNFTQLLAGDAIDSQIATADLPLICDSSDLAGDDVVVWVSGGVAGDDNVVAVKVITTGGRTFERSFTVPVRQL